MSKTARKLLWWLLPVLLALALVGVLLVADSSAGAPFVYTVF